MKAEWMAKVGGKEYGPFTWDQMLQMAAEGRVTPELPIRQASDSQWSTAAAIPGLLSGKKLAQRPLAARSPAKTAAVAGKSAKEKARPLGPPASRPIPPVVVPPQNIPTGIPVDAVVGTALGSSPLVEPPPVASSASGAFSIDLGASPSGKQRSVKKLVLDDDDGVVVKKKNNTPLIIGIFGGVTALVAIVVGLAIYITTNRGGKDERIVATDTSAGKQVTNEGLGESNPGEENSDGEADAGAKKPAAAAANKVTKDAKKPAPDQAAQLAALRGIRKWNNAAILVSLKVGNAKISLSRIWMSADAGGKFISAAADDPKTESADNTAANTPGAASAHSVQPKYVFVEVTVANIAGATLKYKGWNIAKTKVPFLADNQDRILRLIPISEAPGVARLTKADIPGGGSISDILVFAAPAESFEKIRLVLPQNVFYDNTTNPYSGIEITPDVLASEGTPPVAAPPTGIAAGEGGDPLVNGRRVPIEPGIPENPAETKKPDPATAVKTEPPPPKKPSLIDEINKSFGEQEKGKKLDEGKGAELEKNTEPVKNTVPAKKSAPAKGKKKK